MPTITEKKLHKSALALEKIIRQAQRKLFEVETLSNAQAIQKGNFLQFKSAKALLKSLKTK